MSKLERANLIALFACVRLRTHGLASSIKFYIESLAWNGDRPDRRVSHIRNTLFGRIFVVYPKVGISYQNQIPSHQSTWNLPVGSWKTIFLLKGTPVRFHVNWWKGSCSKGHGQPDDLRHIVTSLCLTFAFESRHG